MYNNFIHLAPASQLVGVAFPDTQLTNHKESGATDQSEQTGLLLAAAKMAREVERGSWIAALQRQKQEFTEWAYEAVLLFTLNMKLCKPVEDPHIKSMTL